MPRLERLSLGAVLALGACTVAPPTGPSILALPPEGKSLAQFQQEDVSCRDYAQAALGPVSPQQGAIQSGVGSAAVGTVLGAAAGALVGSAVGSVGAGAAIGAGAGLLTGSAVGLNTASASSYSLQARYDGAYAQCIASTGNRVEAAPPVVAYAAPYGPYVAPYGPYYAPYYYGGPAYGPAVSFGFYGGGYRYGRPYGYRRW
jgi:outer membrane lipoprotein SlyB